jgi:hypothetical protein
MGGSAPVVPGPQRIEHAVCRVGITHSRIRVSAATHSVVGMAEWESVLQAVQTALGGDAVEGRRLMEAAWAATDEDDHAMRCVLAHYLADAQDTLDDEIRWDESALGNLPHVADDELAPIGIPSAAGLAPSLHLNLGDGYLRRGDLVAARREQEAGAAALGALGEDGYAQLIRQGLERLGERLTEQGA